MESRSIARQVTKNGGNLIRRTVLRDFFRSGDWSGLVLVEYSGGKGRGKEMNEHKAHLYSLES